MSSELMRLEERICRLSSKMAECHRVIRLAEEAREQLEQLRIELKNVMAEYTAGDENKGVRLVR